MRWDFALLSTLFWRFPDRATRENRGADLCVSERRQRLADEIVSASVLRLGGWQATKAFYNPHDGIREPSSFKLLDSVLCSLANARIHFHFLCAHESPGALFSPVANPREREREKDGRTDFELGEWDLFTFCYSFPCAHNLSGLVAAPSAPATSKGARADV